MYNSFTAGTNSDPDKYNNELRQISQEFKTAGVKYVILDLRYNAGGSLDCVQLLGTILTSEVRLNKPMAYLEYNNKNRDKDATINFDSEILKSGVNLDLPALFAITSSTTAGAPEMLIRSLFLKDSYPVVTIGGVTKGQNVATEQFINEEFLWSINPVSALFMIPTTMPEELSPLQQILKSVKRLLVELLITVSFCHLVILTKEC